ncbi:MAG: hypothetical protein LM577_04010 [Thermoproteaceae archaeon]|nr:hypothetical protein [Thermoproteaceae archaeon]
MIVASSSSVGELIWRVRSLLPHIEAAPLALARSRAGEYSIALGTLGHLYLALSSVLETLVEARRMADDLGLGSYTIVIGPGESYITTASLPEVIPPLPEPPAPQPLPAESVELDRLGCPDLTPGMVKFCVDGVEIAYYLPR